MPKWTDNTKQSVKCRKSLVDKLVKLCYTKIRRMLWILK